MQSPPQDFHSTSLISGHNCWRGSISGGRVECQSDQISSEGRRLDLDNNIALQPDLEQLKSHLGSITPFERYQLEQMGRNSKRKYDHVSAELGSCSDRIQHVDKKIWSAFPDDLVLSVMAKLSWDEIIALSHTWGQLSKALMKQGFLEEYAASRLQKPICVLEGNSSQDLTYTMVAGDGQNKFQTLSLSKQKAMKTLTDCIRDTYDLPVTSKHLMFEFYSVDCFVIVDFINYMPKSPRDKTFLLVMNPTNGTASQIYLPDNMERDITGRQFYVTGIFKTGDSEYQILLDFYERNQDGDLLYNLGPPQEDRQGLLDNYATGHPERDSVTFHLYKSTTKSWTSLVRSNMFARSEFRDPVLYKGAIHALLVADSLDHFVSISTSYQVCYVEERSGRTKWMPLAVPLPCPTLCFAHLFMFHGTLMLAAGVPLLTGSTRWISKSRLSKVCIWRLHEESQSWSEAGCMPDAFVKAVQFRSSDRYRSYSSVQSCYTNGDYMMLITSDYKCRQYSMVMFNIATNHWQLIRREGSRCPHKANKALVLFEPRLDRNA